MLLHGSASQPSAALLPQESQGIRHPAGDTAIILLLREPKGCDSQTGSEPLGTGSCLTASDDVRPGGRPGVSFRRTTPFVPFSGRRESASRRRRGCNAASRLDLSAFGSSPDAGEPRHTTSRRRRGRNAASRLDLSAFGSSPDAGEPRHTTSRKRHGHSVTPSGTEGMRFADRERALGHGLLPDRQ